MYIVKLINITTLKFSTETKTSLAESYINVITATYIPSIIVNLLFMCVIVIRTYSLREIQTSVEKLLSRL